MSASASGVNDVTSSLSLKTIVDVSLVGDWRKSF